MWLSDVINLKDELHRLQGCITAVRRDRHLVAQIQRVIAIDPGARGDGLGSAVLRDNRLITWMERSLVRQHTRLEAELACARDILTSHDLLQQAQQEWDDLAMQWQDPVDEASMSDRLREDRVALIGRLRELVHVLHPGASMPAVECWIGHRMADLQRLASSDAGSASL